MSGSATPVLETPSVRASNAQGWVVTMAALGINLASGTLYAWSVIGKSLASPNVPVENRWSAFEAALPFAVATATFALMMIFAGRMQDKLGPRRIAMVGGVVLGLGFIAAGLSFAVSRFCVAVSFGLVGLGIGLAYAATTPAAIKWFPPQRKGMITGLVVAGVGLAAVYASPLTGYLLSITSPQNTLLICGVATIVVIVILAQFVRNPPLGYIPPRRSEPSTAPGAATPALVPRHELNWHDMLQTPSFYLLWAMFILAAAPGLMLLSNIAKIAAEKADVKNAALVVMVLAIFNTLGRVVGGFISDRMGRTHTMILFFAIQTANMFAFAHYTSPELIFGGAALTGLCYGTIFTLFPAAAADFYGVKNLGVNYGFIFTAFGVAGASGALLGGKMRDVFQSYDPAFFWLACGLLGAMVLALFTKVPKRLTLSAATEIPAGTGR